MPEVMVILSLAFNS